MTSLNLTNIEKEFDGQPIIRPLDLRVEHGEFVVFVGPSGCGKTTLLRMIAGLEGVSNGEIEIDGRLVTQLLPVDRGVAMVFQSYALYPHMTVEENIGFGLRIAGMNKADRREKVLRAAKVLQLEPYLKRKPKALSGGQRQRVAIGRAIVKEPGIFLFDEPLSNLDAELRVQMRLEIARLHQDLGATMIYVTHDQVEAMTLADKIVVLRAGRIEQVGRPIDLYDDPDNLFVAGFIGSPKMNFVEARVVALEESGAIAEVPGLGAAPVTIRNLRTRPKPGTPLILGFRPEHVALHAEGGFAAKTELVEQLGNVAYIHAAIATGARITIEQRGSVTMRPGEAMRFSLDPDRLFAFEPSGARL
jgi:ABC-type sugar transport system ATPase subunit